MADYGGIIVWDFVIDCRNRSKIPPYTYFFPIGGRIWRNLAELFRWKLGLKRKNFIIHPHEADKLSLNSRLYTRYFMPVLMLDCRSLYTAHIGRTSQFVLSGHKGQSIVMRLTTSIKYIISDTLSDTWREKAVWSCSLLLQWFHSSALYFPIIPHVWLLF